MRSIREIELPEFHEDRAAGLGAGLVARLRRIADIAAGRKVAVLVVEDAVQHEKLLSACMLVG